MPITRSSYKVYGGRSSSSGSSSSGASGGGGGAAGHGGAKLDRRPSTKKIVPTAGQEEADGSLQQKAASKRYTFLQ